MKYSRTLLLIMMILPWFSIPLMGKRAFNQYLSTGLLMAILVRITNAIAKKRKWWWWYETIFPKLSGSIPFILGPFLVGSLWILKWSYGRLFKFVIVNLIYDGLFTYVVVPLLTKFGIASLVRMKKLQLMYVFAVLASILYIFQLIKELIQHNHNDCSKEMVRCNEELCES
ncbi:hypothetical protein [Bacillus sp. DNRA2]|uniref:hypothetical protein n=1 Tax=Bacillus sp. DNRA2 TaxID=2723053 RepID=UPI001B7D227C|nr:hypothetical protein [Bacillus sp. DNRA2]